MKMRLIVMLLISAVAATSLASGEYKQTEREFTKYDIDGNVLLTGTYTRDAAGKVIRYDVFEADGSPKYSEIPYYRNDGKIIRADVLSPDGTLLRVAVFFESTVKVFDSKGNELPEYESGYSVSNVKR
ncbi:MAG: hypothetical protein M9935_08720 [Kiritimatiellae bacterium]|nr:hypothetical protein [Kiritimatiellia bacterium]